MAATEEQLRPDDLDVPCCERGLGSIILTAQAIALVQGVSIQPVTVWPDDRGHFLEVHRGGQGLTARFRGETTQISATLTYPGVVKAFHHHLQQYDCWTVVSGMLQVALVDLRKTSPTFGQRNTIYIGELRPWQVLIPPGVAHGYKVIGHEPAVLVYVTSRFYDPADECRIAFDDSRLNYDWNTQFK